jgi:hypothetical protein
MRRLSIVLMNFRDWMDEGGRCRTGKLSSREPIRPTLPSPLALSGRPQALLACPPSRVGLFVCRLRESHKRTLMK